jgi:hypothetical protein
MIKKSRTFCWLRNFLIIKKKSFPLIFPIVIVIVAAAAPIFTYTFFSAYEKINHYYQRITKSEKVLSLKKKYFKLFTFHILPRIWKDPSERNSSIC